MALPDPLPLHGKTVVVTGLRSRERERMEKAVAQLGGTVPPADAVLRREDPPVACVAGSVNTARYAACAGLLLPMPVPVVKPSWLRACLEAKKLVRENWSETEKKSFAVPNRRRREKKSATLRTLRSRPPLPLTLRPPSPPRPKKKLNPQTSRSRPRGTPSGPWRASASASRAAPPTTRSRSPRPWSGRGRSTRRT